MIPYKLLTTEPAFIAFSINEMRSCEVTAYKTTLLSFVNCVIFATENLDDRVHIRNEFIGK